MSALESVLQEVRKEIRAIVDNEGNLIESDEVEAAIAQLLRAHLEDCQFRHEIQEWLDNVDSACDDRLPKNRNLVLR